jgi:hypothetical protein
MGVSTIVMTATATRTVAQISCAENIQKMRVIQDSICFQISFQLSDHLPHVRVYRMRLTHGTCELGFRPGTSAQPYLHNVRNYTFQAIRLSL